MNINDYINYYGDYSFDQRPFNEVDNLIFAVLSYVNFSNIIKKNITLADAGNKFFEMYSEEDIKKNILEIRSAIKFFKNIKDKNRFKNIIMSNYVYIGNEESQFSVVTFKIAKDTYYVSFEGTDQLISGWEENLKMAYRFPVKAQTFAKDYLNKYFTFKRCKLIVGGHSKGGNLALVSSMYANYFVKKKIIGIYNYDGQGLRFAQINSKQYESIENRYFHIIPNHSLVGLLLRHKDNYIVIKSNKRGLLAHDAFTWEVSYDHLVKDKLSRSSKIFEIGFEKWLDSYDDEKRKLFVDEIFKVLYDNNIRDLTDIRIKKELIIGVIKSSKNIKPIVKEMFFDLIKLIGKTNLEIPLF